MGRLTHGDFMLEEKNKFDSNELPFQDFGIQPVMNGQIRASHVAEFYRIHVSARCGAPRTDLVEWMTAQLVFHGICHQTADNEAVRILNALIEVGDFGSGTVFGQQFIVPLAPSYIILPNGSIAVLGESRVDTCLSDDSEILVRRAVNTLNKVDSNLFDDLGPPSFSAMTTTAGIPIQYKDLAGVRADSDGSSQEVISWANFLSGRPFIRNNDNFSDINSIPSQLRKAFLICGVLHDNGWSIDKQTAESLTDWLGISIPVGDEHDTPIGQDFDQVSVISAPSNDRIVTEAGPGSGKTFVACERIAHLIREGVAPPRIWLLSFTRVAVEEIRSRISTALDDHGNANAINVATFDSFAWRLNSSFASEKGSFSEGYDKAIERAVSLFTSDDMMFDDFLRSLEHIVVDEAQDLVGKRRELVERLLLRLPDKCGVTVLGDFAQAIYGFQEKSGMPDTASLSDRLLKEHYLSRRLGTDHRTQNPVLENLFYSARNILRDQNMAPDAKYFKVRSLIEESASATVRGPLDPRFSSVGAPLVLFRGRNALLSSSNEMASHGKNFQLKLSDRECVVAPWIGALLSGLPDNTKLRYEDFQVLWRDLSPEPFELGEESAWNALSALAGRQGKFLSIEDLCDALNRSLPVSLIKDHIGSTGPRLSTIHGAKGREADRVLLMLPQGPSPNSNYEIDWEEEARILYVGATRARKELLVGSKRSGYFRRCPSGRQWRGGHGKFSIEIGLANDLGEPLSASETGAGNDARTVAHAIWSLEEKPVEAFARRNASLGSYEIFVPSAQGAFALPLAHLSTSLINDLCYIAGVGETELPEVLGGFYVIGGTSIALGSVNPTGVTLAPVLTGFIQVNLQGI